MFIWLLDISNSNETLAPKHGNMATQANGSGLIHVKNINHVLKGLKWEMGVKGDRHSMSI